MDIISLLVKYKIAIAGGLLVTIQLCLLIWSIGIVFGAIVGYARHKWPKSIGRVLTLATFVISGMPVLVLLYWLHFPVQAYFAVTVDPFWTAVLALSSVNIAMVSEDVRVALNDFPEQYISAAKVCGISRVKTIYRIQAPLILRRVLPSVLKTQVYMLQATLFASLISVQEIFRVAQTINSEEYRPVEVYSTLAIFFLSICLPMNWLANWMQRRFTRDTSEV